MRMRPVDGLQLGHDEAEVAGGHCAEGDRGGSLHHDGSVCNGSQVDGGQMVENELLMVCGWQEGAGLSDGPQIEGFLLGGAELRMGLMGLHNCF